MGQRLGDYLRECRTYKGLSQAQVAARLGWTSTPMLSMIERGQKEAPLVKIKAWGDVVGANPKILRNIMVDEYWTNISHVLFLPQDFVDVEGMTASQRANAEAEKSGFAGEMESDSTATVLPFKKEPLT